MQRLAASDTLVLNDDALIEVFSNCVVLDSLEDLIQNSCLDTRRSPWILGHICRRWRRLVLSSPLLWTSVNLHLDHPHCNGRRMHFLLNLYLSRSASCSLDVKLRSETYFQSRPSYLNPLLSASSRWLTLTMNIPISSYRLFSVLTGFLDSLKVLHIRHPYRDKVQIIRDLGNLTDGIRIFKFCQNLKRLSIQDIPYPRDIFCLPWAKLEHFSSHSSLNVISNLETFRTLQGVQSKLTSCLLECRLVAKSHRAQQLTLPVLKSMTLLSVDDSSDVEAAKGTSKTEAAQIISWLTLPALEHLQLRHRFRKEYEAGLLFELIELIQRSRCVIRGLHLGSSPSISDEGFVSILNVIPPSFQKLCVLSPGYTEETSRFPPQVREELLHYRLDVSPLRAESR